MTVDRASICEICEYAKKHHGWPPALKGTHCSECHQSWTGFVRAHCVRCCETFSTDGVAQHHWTADGHRHPSEIAEFWQDAGGYWHHGGRRPALPKWAKLGAPEPFRVGRDTRAPAGGAP
jgi:hypothetical protein